jgi:hypothetical protein
MAIARRARLGLFNDPESAANAVSALKATGVRGVDIKILTDTPYPEGAFGEDTERHRLYVFPFVGACCGFSVGLLLTIATQLAYPIVTGGKPILSIPPMVHVIYEGSMLGAILFTVMGILFESRLPEFKTAPYDPRISEGYIGVLVVDEGDRADRLLNEAGALDIVTETRSGAPVETRAHA